MGTLHARMGDPRGETLSGGDASHLKFDDPAPSKQDGLSDWLFTRKTVAAAAPTEVCGGNLSRHSHGVAAPLLCTALAHKCVSRPCSGPPALPASG